jgi:uncharacterized repeat protein (TIGR01451 family)
VDWYSVSCAHSQALNCNQKGYATWWLWARLSGWSGSGSQLTASTDTAIPGQTITYTIVVRDTGAPLTSTVYVTNVLPSGLSYQPGTFTATAGTVSDANAPTLRWSGVLTPTPVVTATYAVTVSADVPQVIVNSAVFVVPGYPPITSTATVSIVWPVERPDLTPSYKTVSSRHVEYGERITYTIGIQNSTGPLSQTVLVTDVIPGGLSYVPGTLTATAGTVDDAGDPVLYWSGVLTPTPNITVTYVATVTHPTTGTLGTVAFPLVNAATIVAPGYDPVTRTVTVWANPYRVFLPLVLKNGTGGTLIWW